jgi:hypothetical protein
MANGQRHRPSGGGTPPLLTPAAIVECDNHHIINNQTNR